MAEKCELCGEKIKEGFMGKISGTVIKKVEDKETTNYYVCPACQKKCGKNLKEIVLKK